MTIFYDVTRLLSRHSAPTPTGIDRVDIHYAFHFLNGEVDAYFVYQNKGRFFLLDKFQSSNLIIDLYSRWIKSGKEINTLSLIYKLTLGSKPAVNAKSKLLKLTRYSHASQLQCERSLDGLLIDKLIESRKGSCEYINVSHFGVGNIDAYYAFKVIANTKIVFYLHDIIPVDYPEYVRKGDNITHEHRVLAMAQYSDLVLVNSNYTKNRFIDFCSSRGLKVPSVSIAIIGVEDSFLSLLDAKDTFSRMINGDYFVYVSTIEPRKNHILLLNLWRSMIRKGEEPPKLVLLGKRGWNITHIEDFLDRCPDIEKHILEFSGFSDKQMVSLIKDSKGLLFSSFVEGWGMPLVEAIALGVPVICSDIEAFRESGQNLCKYIDPLDTAAWKHEILNATNSDAYISDARIRYEQFKIPSWDNHFTQLEKDLLALRVSSVTEEKDLLDDQALKQLFSAQRVSFTKGLVDGVARKKSKSSLHSRRLNKFKKDPVKFFLDSRFFLLRYIGRRLQQG